MTSLHRGYTQIIDKPINYKNADVGSIQRAIENCHWKYAFESKTINEKVQVLSEVLMNILSNFVPQKSFKFNYKQLHE